MTFEFCFAHGMMKLLGVDQGLWEWGMVGAVSGLKGHTFVCVHAPPPTFYDPYLFNGAVGVRAGVLTTTPDYCLPQYS